MTTAEELQEDFLLYIQTKREELDAELDESTMPFIKTLAEPESEEDEEYAQSELDDALSDKGDCDELLDGLEEWLNHNLQTPSKNRKRKA